MATPDVHLSLVTRLWTVHNFQMDSLGALPYMPKETAPKNKKKPQILTERNYKNKEDFYFQSALQIQWPYILGWNISVQSKSWRSLFLMSPFVFRSPCLPHWPWCLVVQAGTNAAISCASSKLLEDFIDIPASDVSITLWRIDDLEEKCSLVFDISDSWKGSLWRN